MERRDFQREGTLAFAQRQAIEAALRRNAFNLSSTARQLRIGRTTLYSLLERYEIDARGLAEDAADRKRKRIVLVNGSWFLIGDEQPSAYKSDGRPIVPVDTCIAHVAIGG